MKKWISFIMILFLAFIFVGCGDDPKPDEGDDKGETVKPTEIVVTGIEEGQELEANQSITLQVKVLPDDATNKKYRVVSSNPAVLKVQDDTITALSAGEVVLTITAVGDTSVKKAFNLKVNGEEAAPVEPTKIILSSSKKEVEINKSTAISISTLPENATKTVKWSSSDESIATITNGIVKGISLGEVTITATSTLNDKVYGEIKIKIIDAQVVEVIAPTSISITGDEELEVGYTIRLVAEVLPAGADLGIVWSSRDESIATVDEKGIVKGISVGSTYIYATSTVDNSINDKIRIKVKEDEASKYPVNDLQGYVIEIMNAESALADIDPFLDGYKSADKMYKQQAWNEVKSKYNCDIKVVAYPDEAPWGPTRYQWINSQAELGTGKADFYVIDSSWIPQLYSSGALQATTTFFRKFGKNQIEPAIKQAGTYKGQLYIISTGLTSSKIYIDQGLFYNYGLIKKYNLESPAKLFNEGRWDFDGFLEWCMAAQAVLGDDMWVLSGAPEMYWQNMVQASGVKVADISTLELNVKNKFALDAVDVLRQLVVAGTFDVDGIGYDQSVESFQSGRAIFQSASYWFVKADNRFPSSMWGEDTEFGYVPYPYHPNITKENSRVNSTGDSVMIMGGARNYKHPAGVNYEDVYRALQEMYLKTIEYQQGEPSYDGEKIKETNLSLKLDDPESIQAAMFYTSDKTLFDPIYAGIQNDYKSDLTSALRNAILKGADYTTEIDAVYSAIETNMLQIYG